MSLPAKLGLLSLLALSACVGETTLPTTPNALIINHGVETVRYDILNAGFIPPPPADVPCEPGVIDYTLTLATRTVVHAGCFPVGDNWEARSGTQSFDEAMWAPIATALGKLVVSDGSGCGADKSTIRLTVTTREQTQVYEDGFYACGHPGIYVDSDTIDALDYALEMALAK